MASDLIGTTVYDEFGAWVVGTDGEFLVARQGDAEVLLLDQEDFSRFGITL